MEYLGWSFEAKAFSGHAVVLDSDGMYGTAGQVVEVGPAWQVAAESAVHVLDAAFLPGAAGIAEVGIEGKLVIELVMVCELGAVVLGETAAHRFGQGLEPAPEPCRDDGGLARGGLGDEDEAGGAFLGDEQALTGPA